MAGFVDSDTMIEFKNKIVDRLLNRKTLCTWSQNTGNELDVPFFHKSTPYKEDVTYSIAVGQRRVRDHYLTLKNGNGFRVNQNDYYHARKKYLNYTLDKTNHHFMVRDLIDLLFGKTFLERYEDEMSFVKTTEFPNCHRYSQGYKIVINENYADFIEYTYSWFITSEYLLAYDASNDDGEYIGNFTRLKGKFYIVENFYDRGIKDGKYMGTFCERVYAYIPLIISINDTSHIEEGTTTIFISKLPK